MMAMQGGQKGGGRGGESVCEREELERERERERERDRYCQLLPTIDRSRFKKHPAMASHIVAMEKRVMAGSMAPGTAADILLDKFLQSSHEVKSDSKIIVS